MQQRSCRALRDGPGKKATRAARAGVARLRAYYAPQHRPAGEAGRARRPREAAFLSSFFFLGDPALAPSPLWHAGAARDQLTVEHPQVSSCGRGGKGRATPGRHLLYSSAGPTLRPPPPKGRHVHGPLSESAPLLLPPPKRGSGAGGTGGQARGGAPASRPRPMSPSQMEAAEKRGGESMAKGGSGTSSPAAASASLSNPFTDSVWRSRPSSTAAGAHSGAGAAMG